MASFTTTTTSTNPFDSSDCDSDSSHDLKISKGANKRRKQKQPGNAAGRRTSKKRIVIADMLGSGEPTHIKSNPKADAHSKCNDTLINMGLNRAQTLKNFIDKIRGNQSQYLPCTFTPTGMVIQCMEPGQKTWVHAELWNQGCDFYGYAHTEESLQITVQFKDFYQLVKGADANDKIFIRIFKADPSVVQLVLQNGKAQTTLAITSVMNAAEKEVEQLRADIEQRINDHEDMEFRVATSELQRKITFLNSAKVAAIEFRNDGDDLIMHDAKVSVLCAIKEAEIRFFNTRIRPARESQSLSQADVKCKVMLKFLAGSCKGPSNSATNQTNGKINLRLGNDKDVLFTETLGSMGKLILGIRTGCQ